MAGSRPSVSRNLGDETSVGAKGTGPRFRETSSRTIRHDFRSADSQPQRFLGASLVVTVLSWNSNDYQIAKSHP
jgi:hypothetical protein